MCVCVSCSGVAGAGASGVAVRSATSDAQCASRAFSWCFPEGLRGDAWVGRFLGVCSESSVCPVEQRSAASGARAACKKAQERRASGTRAKPDRRPADAGAVPRRRPHKASNNSSTHTHTFGLSTDIYIETHVAPKVHSALGRVTDSCCHARGLRARVVEGAGSAEGEHDRRCSG